MLKDKDSKQSIQVTIRVRPLSQKQLYQDSRICVKLQQNNSLHLINNNQTKNFTFDSICFNQSQEEIFNRVGKKCTADCLQGYNCTIFAYGQTGAGKTYTMMGISFQNQKYYEHRGLIPRTMQYLFDCIQRQRQNGVNYIIRCSFLEIYNQQIVDLLNKVNNNLQLRQDTKKGVYVQGITQQIINKSDEAMQILYKGSKSRHVGSTHYNQTSSRSHSVFTMQIESRHSKNGIVNTKSRQFNFIDLAGSERTKQSTGQRLKQGCNINKSLMNLSTVISALSEVSSGKMQHINYRNSKLTFLLKDSLGGNSKTNLIANISPATVFYHETQSTLGFARRAKMIKLQKASINEDSSGSFQSLKNQNKRLKQQNIDLKSRLHNSPTDISSPTTQSNPSQMTAIMHQYVQQQIDKQTKLQQQLLKKTQRISQLQKGIKQYSKNQIHLRMINSILQDKINRLKNIQKTLIQKINDLNQSDQQSKNIIQYFTNQRNSLLKQVQIFKKQTQNLKFLRQLFKQAKIMKDESQDDSLRQLLTKNTNFLNVIHTKLDGMKVQKMQVQLGTQVQKKINNITIEFNKKQQEYIQRLQQFQLQINQYRVRHQQNQRLLEEAINGQIILEQKLQQENQNSSRYSNQISDKNKQIMKLQKNIQENTNKTQQIVSQYKSIIQQKQMTITMLKNDNDSLRLKYQNSLKNQKIFKQQFQNLQEEKYKIEKNMMMNIEELKELKNNILKYQSEIVVLNQKIEILENQKQGLRQENNKNSTSFNERQAEFQVRCRQLQSDFNNQLMKKQRQMQKLTQKYSSLQRQQKSLKASLIKHQSQYQSFTILSKKQQTSLKEQLMSLQQKNKELIHLINQKKLTDNQLNTQFNNLKLQNIQLNSLKQNLQHKYKIHLQDLTQKLHKQNLNMQTLKKQSQALSKKNQQLMSELQQKNKQTYKNQQSHIKMQHSLNNIKQQLTISQNKNIDNQNLIQSLRQKQKQLKISIINLKNQLFIITKNSQIQLQASKSQIVLKDQHIDQIQKENVKNKNKYQKMINDLKKQMDNNKELFNSHQESMKKSMQNHLLVKEKKIQEIKGMLEESQSKNKDKESTIIMLNSKLQEYQGSISNQQKNLASLNQLIQEKDNKIQSLVCQFNQMKQKYQKEIEENQISHGEQIDQKNQKIEFYMIENQKYVKNIQSLQIENQRNQLLMTQIKTKNSNLEGNLQVVKAQNVKLQDKNSQIQSQLNQITLKQQQITAKFYQTTLQLQKTQKDYDLFKQKRQLQVQSIKLNQNTSIKQVNQINQTLNKQLQQSKSSYIAQIQKTYALSIEIQSCKKVIQQQKLTIIGLEKTINDLRYQNKIKNQELQQESTTIIEKQRKISDLEYSNKNFQAEVNKLNNVLQQKQQKINELSNKISQSTQNSSLQLQTIIKKNSQLQQTIQFLKACLQTQQHNLTKQQQTTNLYRQNIKQLQSNLSSLQQQLQKNQQKTQNLMQNQQNMTIQIQQIIKKYKYQQDQSNKYKILSQSLKNQLQEQQTMINTFQGQQKKMRQIQEDMSLRHSKQIDKINLQLTFYTQQCKKFTQQIINQEHILQKLGQQNQKLKIIQINDQQLLKNMNVSLQEMQEKHEYLINQTVKLRKTIQDQIISKENIYKQLCRQKQNTNNLKMLIDNKSAQNNVLQHQLQEKDSIYKKLVEKIAKNQSQSKKTTNSEHYLRTIQLLQKSRAQQIELRKQNQDFKKIMTSMKQALQQKQTNCREIQKKSQNYCISMHKRMQEIQNDYVQLQRKQEKLLKEKKSLEKFVVQNQQYKQQIQRLKANSLKNIQRYQQLQSKLKKTNLEYIQLQKTFQQFKKGQNMMFNPNDDKTTYINRLKAEIAALKTQKTLLTDTLNKQREQKTKLKADLKYGKQNNTQSSGKSQLDKKIHQNKNLQQLIFEIVSHLKICVNQPKTKLQAIRSVILSTIKQKNTQIKSLKQKIRQYQFQTQKSNNKPEYAVYRQKNREIKALSISNANRNLNNNQELSRFQKDKDPSFLNNNSRQKIKEFQNHYARLGQNQEYRRNN